MARIIEPRDPRERRRHRAPDVDHLAAAVRLDVSLQQMRARDAAAGAPARGEDEPPTGLIDLNAVWARLGQARGEVDPAADAWLAGGADPTAAAAVADVDYLDQIAQAQPAPLPVLPAIDPANTFRAHWDEQLAAATAAINATADQHAALELTAAALADVAPAPVEYDCEQMPNAFHTNGPCGAAQHPADVLEVAPLEPGFFTYGADGRRVVELPTFSSERGPGGWRSRHDVRSLAYGVRRSLTPAPIADRLWPVGPVLDQGDTSECVGFGIVDALNARAAGDVDLDAGDAHALYVRADQLDGDGRSGQGTSVLAGMQAALEGRLIGSYEWCFGTRDIAQALVQRGPVVLGLRWLPGMAEPGPGGLMTATGTDTGAGHCLAAVGILLRGPQGQTGPFFVLLNSYDLEWGDRGLGYLHHRDLAAVLHGVGEAALPLPAGA